jgi:hypothetical protein
MTVRQSFGSFHYLAHHSSIYQSQQLAILNEYNSLATHYTAGNRITNFVPHCARLSTVILPL